MIKNRQVHKVGGRDMKAQAVSVAGLLGMTPEPARHDRLLEPDLTFAT